MLLAFLFAVGIGGIAAPGLAGPVPQSDEIRNALERLGWAYRNSDRLGRERFSVSFPVERHFGTHGKGLARVGIFLFRSSGARPDSIGLELLLWGGPRDEFDRQMADVSALIQGIGLPADAAAAAIDLLAGFSSEPGRLPLLPTVHRTDSLVIHARGAFNDYADAATGEHRVSGYALIQLTRAAAAQSQWPTVQEVDQLQPAGRTPMFFCNADVPCMPDLSVADLSCRRIGRREFHCRYRLTADDWIGDAERKPNRHYFDRFRRTEAGNWIMVSPNGERD